MKREELKGILRQKYDKARGFGVVKADNPAYQNIWFLVPPPPPRKMPSSLPLQAMSKAHNTLSGLPGFSQMSEIDKLINHFFIRREAIESSRMEGTWSTIDDVLTPNDVSVSEERKSELQSVKGYAHALEKHFTKALKQKELIFTENLLIEIHKDIVSKDPHFMGIPGQIRTPGKPGDIVRIGGLRRKEESIYNPPPSQYVKSSLRKVLEWLSDEELAQSGDAGVVGFTLPVRLAMGHSHFEGVHPFSDGNGRVGRSLWPLQMICSDKMPLYLSGYVETQSNDYSEALQAAQKKLNYAPIIEFISEAICQSAKESKITRAAIENLPEKWRSRAKFRVNSASYLALEELLRNPIITTTILMEKLNLSKQAVSVAVNQLVERKIVKKREKSGKTEVYAAEELITLLSRKFGSDAELALASGYESILQSEH